MTRLALLLTAIAGVLALAACGSEAGGTSGSSNSDPSDKAYEGALKFAKCMREHGVDVPDPKRDADGGVQMVQRRQAGDGVSDAKVQAAQKDCEKHLEAGGGPVRDPAREARMQDALFAYARCMRTKGIDMPDPQISGGKVTMRVGSESDARERGPGPESAAFKAADKACHHHLAEMEKDAPKADGK